ncbi:terminase small subunit [Trichococcus palustris]|uniref:Terminase small subunit n=1 Tax=Trichococcus palustris TaxID=140314 RepID=A0A143Y7I0_9LACT|nr:terminase small subunit [Trichococcus palustris]CZQ83826.1 terminase small subunit [Trichococcus palustris]SFK70668.1 phage terminase small subunit [Trichococcus palustris]
MAGLTLKQQRFADEYIICANVEQAALKAGYSRSYARANAYKLLANVSIKAYVDERLEALNSEKVADQQEVMEFLTSVMRGEVTEPVPIFVGDGFQEVMNLKPNVQARRAAAVDLGKRYGMWTEKIEQTNRNIEIVVGDWDADDED